MDDNFRYFYPVKILKQMSFEGKEFHIPVYGEGHIQYFERLLCGKEPSKLTSDNSKVLKNRLNGKMCPVCEEKYKAHPDSAWYRYVNGQAIKSTPLTKLNETLTSL